MKVEAINVGRRETIRLGSRVVDTGIDKHPVERAWIAEGGVVDDVVADQRNHGGPDQALYLYSRTDYVWWHRELGRELPPGTFGENLTVSRFGHELRPGDRLRIGPVLLELTSPRIPCSVFAHHMDERRWVKRFRDAERPGSYARVLEPGEVEVGDPVEHTSAGESRPTLLEHFRLYYDKAAPVAAIERALAAPISIRERASLEQRLRTLA